MREDGGVVGSGGGAGSGMDDGGSGGDEGVRSSELVDAVSEVALGTERAGTALEVDAQLGFDLWRGWGVGVKNLGVVLWLLWSFSPSSPSKDR